MKATQYVSIQFIVCLTVTRAFNSGYSWQWTRKGHRYQGLQLSAKENEVPTRSLSSSTARMDKEMKDVILKRQQKRKKATLTSSSPRTSEKVRKPARDARGIFLIRSEAQHAEFLKANSDKLIVMKFTAGYCRACAAHAPKFAAIVMDKKYQSMPIVWADFTVDPSSKPFFRKLGVLSLPTIHFYNGSNGIVENFSCGPSKIPLLISKLADFLDKNLDPDTRQLKQTSLPESSDAPCTVRQVKQVLVSGELITQKHMDYLRNGIEFFKDLTDEEFEEMLGKANLETFMPGDIVIRQGMPGKKFYVIKTGVLEMSIRSRFADPISTPPSYLGAVVNEMSELDYFGERALTTCEPYAASVKCVKKARCFTINVEDIPSSSILSKQRKATQSMVDRLSQRYALPKDYTTPTKYSAKDENILELLVRFQQIRQVAKCFEYVMSAEPLLGNKGEIARRYLLVSKLSSSQRDDFEKVFHMMDDTHKGTISLLDMRRLMESARKSISDEELLNVISKSNPKTSKNHDLKYGAGISLDEFLGVMAEAELYNLFTETFQALDEEKTGYVRAGDLDEVLGGVRDLISNDRKSIIDVEDQDIQVDYEQFARMLLGVAV